VVLDVVVEVDERGAAASRRTRTRGRGGAACRLFFDPKKSAAQMLKSLSLIGSGMKGSSTIPPSSRGTDVTMSGTVP
jgi:hypothetical protein